jgi:GNAT superfamily N-acetyltransferase
MMSVAAFEPLAVDLRDGRRATVRAIGPGDADKLQAAVRAFSTTTSYYRFFSPIKELSAKMLEKATRPDPERELQLVAVVGEGADERIVAGARYSAVAAKPSECEFAIAVVDGWHGLGLARPLLEALMRTARDRGFRGMEGYVLATNAPMLRLAKRLGFREGPSDEGASVRRVHRDLGALV